MNRNKTADELLRQFIDASIEHYRASEDGDAERADRLADRIDDIVRQLWIENGQTKEALMSLSQLAQHKDARIAIMAATYTVELYPEVAKDLRRLKPDKSLVGLLAKYTLQNWERGEMRVLKEVLNL